MKSSTQTVEDNQRFLIGATVLIAVLTLALLIASAWRHGIWIDEIWSFWMSRRDIPLHQLVSNGWLRDAHPMMFPALQSLMSPALGDSVFLRRLTNLAPLAFFTGCIVYLWRRFPAYRAFALVFFVLVITSKKSLTLFPEFRSYFSLLCMSCSLAALMYPTFAGGRDLDTKRDRGAAAVLALVIVVTLNLHYLSDVLVGSFLLACTLGHAYLRRWKWAGLIVGSTIAGILPLLIMVKLQAPYLAIVTKVFWIHTTPFGAFGMLSAVVAHTLFDNVVFGLFVAAALAAVGLGLLGRQAPAPLQPFAVTPGRDTWVFVAACVGGIALADLVLMGASFAKPILEPRYLTATVAMVGAAGAALVADRIAARRWAIVGFVGLAVAVAGLYALKPLRELRWEVTARYLQAEAPKCPTSIVYAMDPLFSQPYKGPINQPEIHDWGYQLVARLHGYKVEIRDIRDPAPLRLAEACPTYLWAEHVNPKIALKRAKASALFMSPELREKIEAAKVFKGRTGFVIVLPPAGEGPKAAAPA